MVQRHFTPDEANALLATVRPLAEQMVEQRRRLGSALERRRELSDVVSGNGGGVQAREVEEISAEVRRTAGAIARCVEQIQELGVLVKDVERGLVDFPALREGEEVLLCWQVGEEEIRYWHRADEGFAGRRELPL
jgi:hypothetical protein